MTNYRRLRITSSDGSKTFLDFMMGTHRLKSDRYILRAADGLGPTEHNIHFMSNSHEGGRFGGFRPVEREITLQISLNPSYEQGALTQQELRRELYSLLPANGSFRVVLGESPQMGVNAMLKRIEFTPFTAEPIVQLVISCDNPYFEGTAITSSRSTSTFSVVNPGNVPVGFEMIGVRSPSTARNSFLVHVQGSETLTIQNAIIPTNADINLDTRPGSRKLVADNGYSLIRFRTQASGWPMLNPGTNDVTLLFTGFVGSFNFRFTPRYWGV